ncbi:hypothetical protein BKK79_10490 [Cupriavidus sp. USMAA2-4]|uniref:hypothetical protein n=1 Tax=Cupriavidus sp. USMAA2-4 TaxID=876364 RepID=UPI0008A672EB|nr:hypothetical protein [Cupriavidus sp. USMAA2-4]AOY92166.1 hypothetical protein BKK79_10490 [Cupriavidus sp. USMAA2-4]
MRDRVVELIDFVAGGNRRYKRMEELTGVKADNWKNTCRNQQRVTQDMVEAIGVVWPQYAYWLVTGKTDEMHGHTSPMRDRIARDLERLKEGGGQ